MFLEQAQYDPFTSVPTTTAGVGYNANTFPMFFFIAIFI